MLTTEARVGHLATICVRRLHAHMFHWTCSRPLPLLLSPPLLSVPPFCAKLDALGWNRSYHQRLFHDDFLKACTRSFWKLEPPGQFARDHQRVLRVNSWDHIAQEILISTPRRFGKTISVSMFCAAMMLSCPGVEISIYSTCKRISQKILRNVQKFALLIADSDYATLNFSVKRENMEEINLQGRLGNTDIRIINSYPSKVCLFISSKVEKSKGRKVEKSKSRKVI